MFSLLPKSEIEMHLEEYIMLAAFDDFRIVSFGKNPVLVKHQAEELGYRSPVLLYVSKEGDLDLYPPLFKQAVNF